jgi:hypothetical protein
LGTSMSLYGLRVLPPMSGMLGRGTPGGGTSLRVATPTLSTGGGAAIGALVHIKSGE